MSRDTRAGRVTDLPSITLLSCTLLCMFRSRHVKARTVEYDIDYHNPPSCERSRAVGVATTIRRMRVGSAVYVIVTSAAARTSTQSTSHRIGHRIRSHMDMPPRHTAVTTNACTAKRFMKGPPSAAAMPDALPSPRPCETCPTIARQQAMHCWTQRR